MTSTLAASSVAGTSRSGAKTVSGEYARSSDTTNVTLRFDLPRVTETWHQLGEQLSKNLRANVPAVGLESFLEVDAGLTNTEDDEKATAALSRTIGKEDFDTMKVLGQFNLGFIIARRQKSMEAEGDLDDLFIIDQHAADEKYNFETLQQTTVIESQKLFRPRVLELSAADELVAVENLEILQRNGFDVQADDATSGPGSRLQLLAQPVSKNTQFDIKDLEELIHLLQDRPAGTMVRCSKARAMFAMRACRKSIMVGMPLTHNQMTSVVRHMGTMDQPWNCPHGRPTMRHLSDLRNIREGERVERTIDWAMSML
ncbi:hypothetical protein SERLA73DRAFT_56795 [Serpula lacrymans var. lacrymans S7.3]|uniref:MutL C-terminal dimerisation domain-containing protein n=2 Tax=Serpula lacrymans var. lacrymans TaxID=341189 RepID=F8Q2X8_SERL3|nr:uncharacterized protein SERLADRAFT_471892 [Serpula lacrymans var. lacrymans S7.9]EGN97539.1 hypothetical protein SERLA73DRAFT_56795 [Serpula lacrymans var. lacrymans S7.3]EGO23137.1 hypothetical protein SERLADRAFT_471892 [Serpula lacrymans var. lacrymans S7.9]